MSVKNRIPNDLQQTHEPKTTTYRCFILVIGAEPLQLGDFLVGRLVGHGRRRRVDALLLLLLTLLLSVSGRVLGGVRGRVEGVIVMVVVTSVFVQQLASFSSDQAKVAIVENQKVPTKQRS